MQTKYIHIKDNIYVASLVNVSCFYDFRTFSIYLKKNKKTEVIFFIGAQWCFLVTRHVKMILVCTDPKNY